MRKLRICTCGHYFRDHFLRGEVAGWEFNQPHTNRACTYCACWKPVLGKPKEAEGQLSWEDLTEEQKDFYDGYQ